MNDLTPTPHPSRFSASPEASALTIEVGKVLKLVAPISMNADAQTVWLASAVEALEGIRASEVAAVSVELRRSVTRPAQIVPEIAKLVADRRRRMVIAAKPATDKEVAERRINAGAQDRRSRATNRSEVEAAARWERQARLDAGLSVPSLALPLSREELDNLPQHIAALGLAHGHLERRNDGKLYEVPAP